MKLIWGSVAADALECDSALQFMSSLAQREGKVYRASAITLAQFGGARIISGEGSGGVPDPRYRAVVAARLDERCALCSTLGLSPSVSDEQLIIQAYRYWGDACPQHLLGDFAFAIWDTETQRLFCARDQLGIMPFYYAQQGSHFYFSSDLEGLLACSAITPKLDLRYVKSYLLHELFVDPHYSFFESIWKLPAGHTLR